MNLIRAVQVLVDAGVDFVIIGGWSAILHGSSYITWDLDVCFSRRPDNLARLATALEPYHPRLRGIPEGPFAWNEAALRNGNVLSVTTELGTLDVRAEVPGVGPDDASLQHSVLVEAFGREARTLDLRALIRSVRAAGRVKDNLILPELEALLAATKKA